MTISNAEIERLTQLAKINISEPELSTIQQSLNNIIQLIGQLQSIDTVGVEPMTHLSAQSQRLREDNVQHNQNLRDQMLTNAPNSNNNFFLVPKVIE